MRKYCIGMFEQESPAKLLTWKEILARGGKAPHNLS
jgi:hypothetical protein